VLFPTLSALAEGYEVYVVVDASGTFNPVVRDAALTRASDAGAVLINWFAVACELQKDWRLGPNAGQVGGAVLGYMRSPPAGLYTSHAHRCADVTVVHRVTVSDAGVLLASADLMYS
jgi:hypothetical protein